MIRYFFCSAILILFFNGITIPQTYFTVENYKQFLSSHKDMTKDQLYELHPAGSFQIKINCNYSSASYFDSINIKYGLTGFEKELIRNNGFMVSERLTAKSFGHAFADIYKKDLPVFISTDAILHAFHRSYDKILTDVEIAFIIPKLKELLAGMHNSIPDLANKYSSNPQMEQMLKDVDLYLSLPLNLLENSVTPYYSSNNQALTNLMGLINNEQPASHSLFSDNCRIIDFSQFKPRGHYAQTNTKLPNYFKAMIWLGRTEIYLSAPQSEPVGCPPQSFKDIRRQVVDAFLIQELLQISNSRNTYSKVEDILKFFVGEPDNVTISNLDYLKSTLNLTSPENLLDSLKLVEFQDTLKKQSFASQRILSQILYSDPTTPDKIIPASAFLLFGQRFIIDSYVTGNVVYDRIIYNDSKVCRLFPSTLDPLFALGNDAAVQLLSSELEAYNYSTNLASLRYLIDNYDNDFWNGTIYNMWLNTIRTLNPPKERNNLPLFMQTAAFWQEKINTQLASWAQLRHDNILYSKQSYTGGVSCTFPYVYVEPIPEFYRNLNQLANSVFDKFSVLEFSPENLKSNIIKYFSNLKAVTDTLFRVAAKELNGTIPDENEKLFLKRLLSEKAGICGESPYDGWYAKLFYDDVDGQNGLLKEDHIVADIHTVPTDCGGSPLGGVVHVGTGPINLGVFVSQLPGSETIAFIGPVLSYQEYTTTNFLRLTDEEWTAEYLKKSFRPSWTNIYLADASGNSRGEGLQLLTSVDEEVEDVQKPQDIFLAQNYPNPFNSTTIIRFTIPSKLSNSQVILNIYNVQGELVKQIINRQLPAGSYVSKWEGTNDNNAPTASGVYFYNLNIGGNTSTGKMILLK